MNGTGDEIFVIGAGAMAEALIRGMIERRAVRPDLIRVINRSRTERTQELRRLYGVRAATSFQDMERARLVVVAVKPFDVGTALECARPFLSGQPVLSMAAGISLDYLRTAVGGKSPVIRSMPNIPVAVLAGATAVAFEPHVGEGDRAFVLYLLGQVGHVVEIPESMMDAATAFSGSGPGFVCYFLEAMEDAAVKLGFSAETARDLLLHTVVGTAKTLTEWGLSPHELRRRVTSPSGTTHAGVSVMEAARMTDIVSKAIYRASERSAEMGKQYTTPRPE